MTLNDTLTPNELLASDHSPLDPHESPSPPRVPAHNLASSSSSFDAQKLVLPLPIPHVAIDKSHLCLLDILQHDARVDDLSEDIRAAEFTMAADRAFAETASGLAAFELKRWLDQGLGVNETIRSPYVITSFVNQHGKQMHRVGWREAKAPASSMDPDLGLPREASPPTTQSQQPKRRSRMSTSVHALLHSSVFKGSNTPKQQANASQDNSRSPPPKKLRKSRSNSDVQGDYTSGDGHSDPRSSRAHSSSVGGADRPQLRPDLYDFVDAPPTDVFQDIMRGSSGPTSPQNSSVHSLHSGGAQASGDPSISSVMSPSTQTSRYIMQPFGDSIYFEAPQPIPSPYLTIPTPPALRLMQSFESGLTARADAEPSRWKGKEPMNLDELNMPPTLEEDIGSKDDADAAGEAVIIGIPISRWDSNIFDVLQTYRGLPLLDKLSEQPVERTIKMSLSEEGAAPRDDPRFVIWGDLDVDGMGHDHSFSHGSLSLGESDSISDTTPAKILVAATIERWIAQLTSKLDYDELLIFFLTYRTYVSPVDLCQLLMCRFQWALEQTTSPRDQSVKLIVRMRTFVAFKFWLRTFFVDDFIPDRDLRLLLAHWLNTLIHDPQLKKYPDAPALIKKLRKVVKDCRTTHLPSKLATRRPTPSEGPGAVLGENFAKSMREHGLTQDEDSDIDLDFDYDASRMEHQGVTDLKAGMDGGHTVLSGNGIIAKGAELVPTSQLLGPLATTISQHRNPTTQKLEALSAIDIQSRLFNGNHSVLSRAFVSTLGRLSRLKRALNRPSVAAPVGVCADVSVFDMDMNMTGDLLSVPGGVEHYLRLMGRASHESERSVVASSATGTIIEGTEEDEAKAPTPADDGLREHPYQTQAVNGPLVRQASQMRIRPVPAEQPTKAPPVEEKELPVVPSEAPSDVPESESSDGRPSFDLDSDASSTVESGMAPRASMATLASVSSMSSLGSLVEPTLMTVSLRDGSQADTESAPTLSRSSDITEDDSSLRSLPPTRNESRQPWQIDVVSIDDLDLSDMSSGDEGAYPHAPPGLKKPSRRLPTRRDFEFVRPSTDSVSSMGITSLRDSIASEQSSEVSIASDGPGLGAGVEQWQLNALVDDLSEEEEEDGGDIEAALRRLEGQIDPQRRRAKQAKVNGWVRTIQDRMLHGDYEDEPPRHLYDDSATDSDGRSSVVHLGGSESIPPVERPLTPEPGSCPGEPGQDNDDDAAFPAPSTPPTEYAPIPAAQLLTATETQPEDAATPTEPETSSHLPLAPLSIGESRDNMTPTPTPVTPTTTSRSNSRPPSSFPTSMRKISSTSRPTTAGSSKAPSSAFSFPTPQFIGMPSVAPAPTTSLSPPFFAWHSSWLLNHRAEVLIKHFSMIDRELFINMRVLELEEASSVASVPEVLDWGAFLKERAKAKSAGETSRLNGVAAMRARINLTANFVYSEILLTIPNERPKIVAKFIRMAWKAYEWNNFSTLVAIVAGLKSEWVMKVMTRSWSKVGKWELRMLDDLSAFTTSAGDFRYIQKTVAKLSRNGPQVLGDSTNESHSTTSRSRSTSESKPAGLSTCIPFLGVYLSELERHWRLPDLIDPTAPNEVVQIDLDEARPWSAPAHPEVFNTLAPLPETMELEPLINVHKQRLIAGVYKRLVDGQHLANKVRFDIDKKIYNRCLRLRGLDRPMLEKVSQMYGPN